MRPKPSSSKRRHLRTLLLALAIALGAYLVFGASDEKRVLGVLRELAAAVSSHAGDTDASRQRRVEAALTRLAVPDVLLETPELGQHSGAAQIGALLERAAGIPLRIAIDQSSVHTEGDRANATLLASVSFRSTGGERRDVRRIAVELSRGSSGFLVRAVRVSQRLREEPEARP